MELQPVLDISTEVIDHHGLVAAVSRDLGIVLICTQTGPFELHLNGTTAVAQ